MTFQPRLEIWPAAQRALWPELADTPEHFTLYGGTALALRIGHRVSADFDFFTNQHSIPTNSPTAFPIWKTPSTSR